MKKGINTSYGRLFMIISIFFVCIFVIINIWMKNDTVDHAKYYLIEINQAENEIIDSGEVKNLDTSYEYLISVDKFDDDSIEQVYYYGENPYVIRIINGEIYRFSYQTNIKTWYKNISFIVNGCLGFIFILMLLFIGYIWMRIIKPFNQIVEMPYQLSKGNLISEMPQQKQKYFGKFLWGLDLLRDKLETQKKAEMKLQKEKKTLILSISHDIKTPLSAIKLYVKALNENLYQDRKKQKEMVKDIGIKAEEIENFVSQIVKASKEDFLKLEVKKTPFYMSELMTWIHSYYSKKLELLKIEFQMEQYVDSLLNGDLVRLEEILQNIIENAIKYGDGEKIVIDFKMEENCYLISVLNAGCFLKKDELPHVFDGFWRGSNVGNQEGSGLGLYICRELIRKMNGDIFAETNGETMRVTIVIQMVS